MLCYLKYRQIKYWYNVNIRTIWQSMCSEGRKLMRPDTNALRFVNNGFLFNFRKSGTCMAERPCSSVWSCLYPQSKTYLSNRHFRAGLPLTIGISITLIFYFLQYRSCMYYVGINVYLISFKNRYWRFWKKNALYFILQNTGI